MSQVYLLPGLLSAAECEEAISFFPPPQTAAIVHKDTAAHQVTPVRRSRASFLVADSHEKQALVRKLIDVTTHANDVYFKFAIAGHEALQLAEYNVGDGYDNHLDIGPGKASVRKLSVTVQLSAAGDYDGGDLELWKTDAADREQGTVIIFPSYLVHGVTPVTRGVRRSLVMWCIGTTPFR